MTETKSKRVIFVVEDDLKIAAVLRDYLENSGHHARVFHNGSKVIAAVHQEPPSAIILDLMVPGKDGMSICRELRQFSDVPILMLTARVEESDKLAGLNIGADDYVCKPFSVNEVIARINAMIRRSEGVVTNDQAAKRIYAIDEVQLRAAWRGQWLPLSPAEYRIAAAMMKQPGRVFSRDQLLDRLGEQADGSSDRAIDSHIKNIRKKVKAVDPEATCFISVYSIGYRFQIAPEGNA